jgi:hypothetical protein
VAALLAGCAGGTTASAPPAGAKAGPPPARDASGLYVVDCLLPAQVKRLGTLTYLGPRRPVKSTAQECEIRGGEYVSYDRADLATSLRVWLPLAQEGDKTAQTYVGEIYEKGLGVQPDYQLAAAWYRKAADQGYPRAQINLGHLYEKALGVERDPKLALDWYRRASGLSDAVVLDMGTLTDQPAQSASRDATEVRQLRAEVDRKTRELEALRAQVDRSRQDLDQARQDLASRTVEMEASRKRTEETRRELDTLRQAQAAGDDARIRELSVQLVQREAEAEQRRQEARRLKDRVASLETESSRDRERLAKLREEQAAENDRRAREAEALRGQLERARRELDEARQALAQTVAEADGRQQKVSALQQEVSKLRQEAAATRDDARLKTLEAQLAQRQAELDQQRQEAARLRQRVTVLEGDAVRDRQQLARLGGDRVAVAGPSIEMVEPSLVATRGVNVVKVAYTEGAPERVIVGKVTAPAGLLLLTVNDREESVDANGLFRARIPSKPGGSTVTVVAVDRQGLRSQVEFQLASDGAAKPPSRRVGARIKTGEFYALVIGNRTYARWPSLKTSESDARATAEILEKRYGFKTRVLLNAGRYDILQALNDLRNKMTEKDNLLIYYAGHGYLDEKINRAYWIPVDADLDSNTEWISTVAITDMVNAISAKHVLLVVDSCYSGALTRSALTRLEAGLSDEAREHWLETMVSKRSRTVLSSGDLKPVLDSGGGEHSVFARAWLDVLSKNDDVLEGERLYREIAARVAYAADALNFEQVPQYAPIRYAGHEAGDFLFMPKGSSDR